MHTPEKTTFKINWLREMFGKLRAYYTPEEYSDKELQEYLLNLYEQRTTLEGRLFNNVSNENFKMSVEQFINYFLTNRCILTGYNVLFKDHEDEKNIEAAGIKFILDNRKFFKNKMEASEHGSNEYFYLKVVQLTFKLLANSFYGILGEKNSIFYNSFVQNSITTTGQDLITNSIMSMETFMANNYKFRDIDDMTLYIKNILSKSVSVSILDLIDTPKSQDEVETYFNNKLKIENPDAVHKIISRLTPEQQNRIYYKNNFNEFINNEKYKKIFCDIMEEEFVNKPSEKNVDAFNEMLDEILEFVYYGYILEDRFVCATEGTRDVIIVVDTDSNFIHANNHVKFITKNLLNKEKLTEAENNSLVNIIIVICTAVLEKVFANQTEMMGIGPDYQPIINMKQEFLYSKITLTRNKKSYAGIITAELGKKLPHPELDMKGLAIKKSTVPKPLRDAFSKILESKILEPENISVKEVLNAFRDLEIKIEESLHAGKMEYAIPKNLEEISSYKFPERIDTVRGAIVWNALFPDKEIRPPEKLNMIKLKPEFFNCVMDEVIAAQLANREPSISNIKNIPEKTQKFIDQNPEKFKALCETVFGIGKKPAIDISKFGFAVICIPKDIADIPDCLRDFIDYEEMLNFNMKNGYILLESLSVCIEETTDNTYKTNIIEI